uniref:Pollen-specific protein C13 n=1 Tax=Ananas comosus var. bracteatus TaxID=296719 RepID=A0A6V7P7S3_ANACO|nr:unnamed protein product [Ananas comosus var. bracteatus]
MVLFRINLKRLAATYTYTRSRDGHCCRVLRRRRRPPLLARVRGAPRAEPLRVQGRVFCDTCRAGFETPATTYLAGAKVRIECRARSTGIQTYNAEGSTDERGVYRIPVTANTSTKYVNPCSFANSLGFEKDTPLPACGELLKQYEEYQI